MFAADPGPVDVAHGASVIGVADIDDAAPDHGALVDGWEEPMSLVQGAFDGFG
jgi:hypothetical protein